MQGQGRGQGQGQERSKGKGEGKAKGQDKGEGEGKAEGKGEGEGKGETIESGHSQLGRFLGRSLATVSPYVIFQNPQIPSFSFLNHLFLVNFKTLDLAWTRDLFSRPSSSIWRER